MAQRVWAAWSRQAGWYEPIKGPCVMAMMRVPRGIMLPQPTQGVARLADVKTTSAMGVLRWWYVYEGGAPGYMSEGQTGGGLGGVGWGGGGVAGALRLRGRATVRPCARMSLHASNALVRASSILGDDDRAISLRIFSIGAFAIVKPQTSTIQQIGILRVFGQQLQTRLTRNSLVRVNGHPRRTALVAVGKNGKYKIGVWRVKRGKGGAFHVGLNDGVGHLFSFLHVGFWV